jgi:glycine/D-amino acid oxidase-like deaminating enzyme
MAGAGTVIVVGAGPTGLALSAELALAGAQVRVLDRRSGLRADSRAICLHARSMEMLDLRGQAGAFTAAGLAVPSFPLGLKGAAINFGRLDSDFPYLLDIPQSQIETLLLDRATSLGTTLRWSCEVTGIEQDDHEVRVRLASGETERADYLVGCDGGLYESFDAGVTWDFKANLPVTQFYKIAVDEAQPVYNVYGGTQDNYSLGGPSRTLNVHGITNQDWFVTWGGDGFQSRVDPKDPNIVYAQLQYGVLSRFDRKSGESILIQPQEAAGDDPLRWNWDSPLLISPHEHTRLYFAAKRLFRSDDRGDSWKAVSPDLTRQLDRDHPANLAG